MKDHTCDFKLVKRYWVGRSPRVWWRLYQCECGEVRREKE